MNRNHSSLFAPRIVAIVALVATGAGCTWDDGLIIENLTGKVIIPREAATRELPAADGGTEIVTDPRLIGPVILGVYPGVDTTSLAYPHPIVGPSFRPGQPGDTYPYGGTSVGDFRFACTEFLACRVVSNRYTSYDDLLVWFRDRLGLVVPDRNGDPVTTGDYIRQQCMEMLRVTADDEIRIIASDQDGDGTVTDKDLDFVENEDGDFEGTFTLWQQEFYKSDDGVGMSLWGWMDAPSDGGFRYSTCDPNQGYQQVWYDQQFFGGRQFSDVLNQPSQYIGAGDWVATEPHIYEEWDDSVVLRLGTKVEN